VIRLKSARLGAAGSESNLDALTCKRLPLDQIISIMTFKLLSIAVFVVSFTWTYTMRARGAVVWFEPTFSQTETDKLTQVELIGRTVPKAKILMASENISIIAESGNLLSLPLSEVLETAEKIKSDANGFFSLKLKLPLGIVQLALLVKGELGSQEAHQISFEVSKKGVFLAVPAKAKTTESSQVDPVPQLEIQWFEPIIGSPNEDGLIEVEILGRTDPKARLNMEEDKISVGRTLGQLKPLPSERGKRSRKSVSVGHQGYFRSKVFLPKGYALVPFQVESQDGSLRSYQLTFETTGERSVDRQEKEELPIDWRRASGFTFTLGGNYLVYDQTSSGTGFKFDMFNFPSNSVEARLALDGEWSWLTAARSTPGKAESTRNFSVQQEDYRWLSLAVEVTYGSRDWFRKVYGRDAYFKLRGGLQHHAVPLLVLTKERTLLTEAGTMSTLSIGGMFDWILSDKLNFEIFMRYQHPIKYGGVFSASSAFIFDGSVGLSRLISERFVFGANWLGQRHQYSYSYQGTTPLENGRGNQVLFFSIFEVQLRYLL
jgi:hypothetical protein